MTTPIRRMTMPAPVLGALLTATTCFAAAAGSTLVGDETLTVSPKDAAPPGMVVLRGGRVTMGTKPKAIEELMTNATNQGMIRVLDGETPEHSSKVGAFAIGKYEVTNEQYLEYLKASGARPPENWAGKALDDARAAFQKVEAEKAIAATKEGGKYDRKKWNENEKNKWWLASWQDVDWGIPKGQDAMPVNYVAYEDALGYARWAGLRLPTEEEWVFAARGDKKYVFPWGDEWEAEGRAHTSEIGSEKPRPVGSFPEGVSPSGVHDMAGSVWEWTVDSYQPFEKFKANTYTFKKAGRKEKVTPEANFNPMFKIIKGGSPQLPLLAARISTRQGAKRSQTTNAVGFRVVSSVTPGVDKANAIYTSQLLNSPARTQGEVFDFSGVVGLDKWQMDTPAERADDYAVVKGYDYVLFTPRRDFEAKPGGELNRESRIQPVVLGFFSTTVPMVSPALPPGDYLVSYREKGKMMASGEKEPDPTPAKDKEKGEAEEPEEVTDETPLELLSPAERLIRMIDLKKDLIIFSTVDTGEYVASIDATKFKTDIKATKADDGQIILSKKSAFDENKEKIQQDWMKVRANIRMQSTSRVLPFEMDLQVDSSALGSGWRSQPISATGK